MDTDTKWYEDNSIYPCIIQDSRDGELLIIYRHEQGELLGFKGSGRMVTFRNIPHWNFVASLKPLFPECFI